MSAEFSRLMRYSQEPSSDPKSPHFVFSDVTQQTVSFLREEAARVRGTDKAGDFNAMLFGMIADAFQAGKRVRFTPVVLEKEGIMPLVVVAIMPLEQEKPPEANATVMDFQTVELLGSLYPTYGGTISETTAREDYQKKLAEHLGSGDWLVFSPPAKLD